MSDEDIAQNLIASRAARRAAEYSYMLAIGRAKDAGWPNTRIARACGVTETSIRNYWKRNEAQTRQLQRIHKARYIVPQ